MQQFLEIFFIGLILSADSFSAALALGGRKHTISDQLKFACLSGGAEGIVSFLGAFLGNAIIAKYDAYDHYIAFVLLGGVSCHMIYEGFYDLNSKEDNSHKDEKEFHSLIKIIIVSLATSLDAFAVGMTFGMSKYPIFPTVLSIGLFAFLSTIIGMQIATVVRAKIGPIFNLIAGFILLALGLKFLIEGIS